MSAFGVSLLAVAGFGVVLWRTKLADTGHRVVELSLGGLMSMLDSEASDAEKEVAVRRAGLGLLAAGAGLLWRLAAALGAAALPVLAADRLGVASRDQVLELMVRPDYLLAVTAAAVLAALLLRRDRPDAPRPTTDGGRYSTGDRFFHVVAFSSPRVLKAAAAIEDRVFGRSTPAASAPPIFITSLARGGTTALLNAMHEVPGVATHTYRDMPFLTAPNLWHRASGGDRRRVERRERAHGDGLEIDLDSPEAFEEVVWKLHWPEKFRGSTIDLWRPEDHRAHAERFLERHMDHVIRARGRWSSQTASTVARYCSKNNGNIARIGFLTEAFPGCRIVVPVRRPECHAASLHRQHQRFLAMQADDDFVARYMRDIGHYDFGAIHKPIAFPGFDPRHRRPESADYWLDYWIQAFTHVLEHRHDCLFVPQDTLRSAPQETMTSLCDALGVPGTSVDFTGHFRPEPDEAPTQRFDGRLLDEATGLYRELAVSVG